MATYAPYIAGHVMTTMDTTLALVLEARFAIADGQEQIADMVSIFKCILILILNLN